MTTKPVKILLRPWCMKDLENLVKYAGNKKIADNLTDAFPHPYAPKDGIAYIETFGAESPSRVFAIEVDGVACGSIGIFPQSDVHRKNAEMGYWLAEDYWGRGIITEAIRQTVEYGFKTFDINRIFARPFGTNLASQRVLEKSGFTLEARFEKALFKNGLLLDELIYAIRKT
jgi:ribosomal-protein-alanine N-acetyltransferase